MRDILVRRLNDWGAVKAEELADYLLENGVIVPPCKVGDMVYWSDSAIHCKPYPMRCVGFHVIQNDFWICCKSDEDYYREFRASSIKKTVFLSKEEAEKALKGDEQE